MKNAERLSNRVRECRKRAGIRQSDLAEQVEVTRQTIIAIEKERFNPSVALGLRIARVLGESMDSLFTLEPVDEANEVPAGPVVALPTPVAASSAPHETESLDRSDESDGSDEPEGADESDHSDQPDHSEPAFEALSVMMGPDEENVSNDPTGILPSPLDGSATEPVQGVWDF